MDSEEPVVVYTVNDPTVAEMIRNALHEEGIVAEISGESQGGFSGVLEIDVLTKAIDADRARKIIEGLEEHHREEAEKDDEDQSPER
jgi:Putative prokaryotic signal transducing protein